MTLWDSLHDWSLRSTTLANFGEISNTICKDSCHSSWQNLLDRLFSEGMRRFLLHHIFTYNGRCYCLKGCVRINPFNLVPVLKISLSQHFLNVWWYLKHFLHFLLQLMGRKPIVFMLVFSIFSKWNLSFLWQNWLL